MTKSITFRIEQCSEQVFGPVRKFSGLLSPKSLIQLLDSDDLSANPRSAKKGSVTSDIEDSLRETPELFPAKTKGILLASSSYKPLERSRFNLTFVDEETEGVLDGGHNALASGRFILGEAGLTERELKKIGDWEGFRSAWTANHDRIDAISDVLDFHMPVEVQVPADMDDPEVVETFRSSLLEIGAARNNNVQLTDETKANKRGFYDALRESLPPRLVDGVEWKTNDGGTIKVRDIIALSWIPLSLLTLPGQIRVNPNQIYRNKAVCVSAFNKLMDRPDVSRPISGGYAHELLHPGIRSAIEITGQLPELYDLLYTEIPSAYNKAGGSFGKITAVKMFDPEKAGDKNPKYLRQKPQTPFFKREVNYTCPDGFIIPLLYGLRTIMQERDGLLTWRTDAKLFLNRLLPEVMKSYRLAIEMAQWDPQKVGKNISTYDFAESAVAATLARSGL